MARVAAAILEWWGRELAAVADPRINPELAMAGIITKLTGRMPGPGPEARRATLERWLLQAAGQTLAQAQACCFDALFFDRMRRVQAASAAEGWTRPARDEALAGVAESFGARGLGETATGALAFLRREILQGAQTGILQEARRSPAGILAFPYVRYRSGHRPDSRARHAILEGFVWRAGHPLEELWMAPNGWGCACVLEPVSAAEAAMLGYRGDFPVGVEKLRAFLAAGGHDDGFPKGVVMRGLPATLIGC